MRYYTSVYVSNDTILYRGVEDGQRQTYKVGGFRPFVWLEDRTLPNPEWKSIDGVPLRVMSFDNISAARDFIETYGRASNSKVYGNTQWQYMFIAMNFPEVIDYDPSQIRAACIDIETTSEQGFPNAENPVEEITAITFFVDGRYHVFGTDNFVPHRKDVFYTRCDSERMLLSQFLKVWTKDHPDVITGWNTRFFDLPYLIARGERVVGQDIKSLSPWKQLRDSTTLFMGRDRKVYDIVGVASLDYLELYKKFCYQGRESYSLNNIAHVELGKEKLDFSEYGNLKKFRLENYQKFIEYNILDTQLVNELDSKLKFLELAYALAYSSRVNLSDVFHQVRMWDVMITNHLMKKRVVVPPKRDTFTNTSYAGAWVKPALVGFYRWVVSYDLDSLYPHLHAQYNISPDTWRPEEVRNLGPDQLLDRKFDSSYLKDKNLTVAANGEHFSVGEQGFLPAMLMTMYRDRLAYKSEMKSAKERLISIESEMRRRGIWERKET